MSPPYAGNVVITVADGSAGVVQVPSQRVQAILGCAGSGVIGQVVPTQSLTTLQSTFQNGPLMEASGQVVQAGGVALAVRIPTVTAGVINNASQATSAISFATGTTGTIVKITYGGQGPHPLQTGDIVTIGGLSTTGAYLNNIWPVTVLDSSDFTIPVTTSGPAGSSNGYVQFSGANVGNFSSQVQAATAAIAWPSFVGTPNDDYYPMVVAQTGFTVGSTATLGSVVVSLDRGTNFGPPIYVGAATSIALQDSGGYTTGLTVNLGSTGLAWSGGGVVNGSAVGSYIRCSTTGPQPNDAGIASGLAALVTYVNNAAATFPIIQVTGILSASDASSIESGGGTNLDTMASSQYLYARCIIHTRDASPPLAWGGSGEAEATWFNSVLAAFSSTTAKRVIATGGYYNIPSAFVTQFASSPSYRRPLSYALGARQVAIDTQRMASRVGGVQGGNIAQIRRLISDLSDGFIYHDESLNVAFDGYAIGGIGRITSAKSYPRKAGFFFSTPLTLGASGSDFQLVPRALVMDVACVIAYNVLVNYTAADFTTKPNGTLSDAAANTIRSDVSTAIQTSMVGVGMISGFQVAVDQTQNINLTNKLAVTITIQGVAYLLEIDVTTGFASQLASTPQS